MKYSANQFRKEHQIVRQIRKLIGKVQDPAKAYPTDAACPKCLLRAKKKAQRNLTRMKRKYPALYKRASKPEPTITMPTVAELPIGGAR